MSAPTLVGSIAVQNTAPSAAFSLACAPFFDDIDTRTTLEWSATGLPAGVTMSSAGLLAGTPTTPGTYDIDVTVEAADDSATPTEYTRRLIVSGAVSAANVYYIDDATGSDTNNGTSSGTPWKTITRGCAVAWQSGGVQIRVMPGTYTGQVLAPQNAGNSASEPIEWTVDTSGGDGVVTIPGPATGSYEYGVAINVANITITRPNADSYFDVDGGVPFGTSGGQIAAGDDPDTVDRIRFGVYINAANADLDLNVQRTAGWNGFTFGPSANNWTIKCNYDQHGTADIGGNEDSGDMMWVLQSFAGEP